MKTVRFTATAAAGFSRVPREIRAEIVANLQDFADDAAVFEGSDVISPMQGVPGLYRLKLEGWRVIFRETRIDIIAIRVAPRATAYRGFRG